MPGLVSEAPVLGDSEAKSGPPGRTGKGVTPASRAPRDSDPARCRICPSISWKTRAPNPLRSPWDGTAGLCPASRAAPARPSRALVGGDRWSEWAGPSTWRVRMNATQADIGLTVQEGFPGVLQTVGTLALAVLWLHYLRSLSRRRDPCPERLFDPSFRTATTKSTKPIKTPSAVGSMRMCEVP